MARGATTTSRTGETMSHSMSAVAPFLSVRGVGEAIRFYETIFGAKERLRLVDPGGTILHAELELAGSLVMLSEENPDWGNLSPHTVGGTPVRVHLYVDDVDEVARKALSAGAEEVIPVDDQFYGDRSGRLRDPFGHEWVIATRIEDISAEEMQRRMDTLFGG